MSNRTISNHFPRDFWTDLSAVARVRQWRKAKPFQPTPKHWAIGFENTKGEQRQSVMFPSKSSLVNYINGAASMVCHIDAARREVELSTEKHEERLSEFYADHETSDLVKELKDRIEHAAYDPTPDFWPHMMPSKSELVEYVNGSDYEPEDFFSERWKDANHNHDRASDILEEAARVVFETNEASRAYALSRLRDQLRGMGTYGPYALQASALI